MSDAAPYHEGERWVQEAAEERDGAHRSARVIDDAIPGRALGFAARQPLAVLASLDPDGDPWASLLFGEPGFVHAFDPTTVEVDLARAAVNPHDPLWGNLEGDPRYGMLLIELETRRRLRVNGRARREKNRLVLHVEEAYPNCPKYIQRRHLTGDLLAWDRQVPAPIRSKAFTAEQAKWIRTSDTFFVASAHPERGADASHRGGNPGFVELLDERTLRIPDYSGNSMFNTLGNFAVHPRGGLVFPDFEGHRTLQATGRTELLLDEDDPEGRTGGTRRFWTFRAEEVLETSHPLAAEWAFSDFSPLNP